MPIGGGLSPSPEEKSVIKKLVIWTGPKCQRNNYFLFMLVGPEESSGGIWSISLWGLPFLIW